MNVRINREAIKSLMAFAIVQIVLWATALVLVFVGLNRVLPIDEAIITTIAVGLTATIVGIVRAAKELKNLRRQIPLVAAWFGWSLVAAWYIPGILAKCIVLLGGLGVIVLFVLKYLGTKV